MTQRCICYNDMRNGRATTVFIKDEIYSYTINDRNNYIIIGKFNSSDDKYELEPKWFDFYLKDYKDIYRDIQIEKILNE